MARHLIDPGPSRAGWHQHENLLTCPRLYARKLEDKRNKVSSAGPPSLAIVQGVLLHTALAHYYSTRTDILTPIEAIREKAAQVAKEEPLFGDLWLAQVDLVLDVSADYLLYYLDDPWAEPDAVLSVEEELLVKIDDELYTQRADLIVVEDGEIFIVDHKTTYAVRSATIDRRKVSGQMLGYHLFGHFLSEKYKIPFGGVKVNLIAYQRSGGGDVAFKRFKVPATSDSISEFVTTIEHVQKIRALYKDVAPHDWPKVSSETACYRYNRPCEYIKECFPRL